jgi:hypothetical protein
MVLWRSAMQLEQLLSMNFDVEPHTSYMEYYIYIKAADYSHDEW